MPHFDAYVYAVARIKTTRFEARNQKEAAEMIWSDISISSALNRVYAPAHNVGALQSTWFSPDGVRIEIQPYDPSGLPSDPSQPDNVPTTFVNAEDESLQPAIDFDKLALVIRNGSIIQALSLCRGIKEVICLNEDAVGELAAEVKLGRTNLDQLNNRMAVRRNSPSVASVDYKAKVLQYLGWTEQITPKKINTMPVELAGEQEWWPDMATTLPRGPKQTTEAERNKTDDSWVSAADPTAAWQASLKEAWKRNQTRRL